VSAIAYACLERNTADFPNIEISQRAVGAREGAVAVGSGKMFCHPGMATVIGEVTVPMVSIDGLVIKALDFLKIDVEGYELRVLQGAERTLRRSMPVVLFKENQRGPLEHGIPNGECARFLEGLGAVFVTSRGKDRVFAWPQSAEAFATSFLAGHPEGILGHLGRDGDHEACNIVAGGYPEPTKKPFKVVSFYTSDNEYAEHARRLRMSLNRFGIAHEIVEIESLGSWEMNCAHKSNFLRDMWNASNVPIVWIDADATIEAQLTLFEAIDADVAFHKWNDHQLASGTIYFGKSALARLLIDRWVLRCEADPVTWDQVHLQSAWCDIATSAPLRTVFLPRTYLQIFDGPRDEGATIVHWQASRKSKREGHTTGNPAVSPTPQGLEDRRHNRLWRTDEEAFRIAEGKQHIISNTRHAFPEGFDFGAALHTAVDEDWPLLEIGCGIGRIASLMAPERYIGVELNPHAIIEARKELPGHVFRIHDNGLRYPFAPTVLLYNLGLNIPDDSLDLFLHDVCEDRKRVIITEVMDKQRLRSGKPQVFNRDPEEYILAMQALGFVLVSFQKYDYKRHDQQSRNEGFGSRLTILVFELFKRH